MPDIFISYSSKDRPVAERVERALSGAGYDVFWDQHTPAGTDWDTWIRERLHGSALVIVLWTKASIASPNVRHEAIVAREADKLLPMMVDQLTPADFPMGLYMVQGLVIGRSAKEFAAAKERLLREVRDRIGTRDGTAAEPKPPRPKAKPWKWIGAAGAAAVAAALALAWPTVSALVSSGAPAAAQADLDAAAVREPAARERLASAAETILAADQQVMGTPWFAGQLLSAAPVEGERLAERYFAMLPEAANAECGCYWVHGIPHSIGNAWVVITSARFGRASPAGLLESILASQHRDGWWAISLRSGGNPAHAAVHPTSIVAVGLAEARRAGTVPPALRPRVDDALRRAAAWLGRGPEEGAQWADYPDNDGRTRNLVFAAMATVASHLAGDTGPRASASAFLRAAEALPEPTSHFASRASLNLPGAGRYSDNYRHPTAPWIGAAAMLAYRHGSAMERRRLRGIVADWLTTDLGDRRLLRHDWIVAETLFLRGIALRETETAR